MVSGAVFLFAPNEVVQVVQVVQNKRSKKSQKLLDTSDILSYTKHSVKTLPIIQPYKNYKMSLREKSKIVCTSSVYAISVPKIDSHNGFFYCLFLAYLSVLKKG